MAWNGTYAQQTSADIMRNNGTSELDSAIRGLGTVMQSQMANQLMQERAGESLKAGLNSLVDDFGKPMQELDIAETQSAEREKSKQLEQEKINQSLQEANDELTKSFDKFITDDARKKLGTELENAITGGQSVSNLRKAIDYSVDNANIKGKTYQKPVIDKKTGKVTGYATAALVGNELEGFSKDLIREYVLYDDKFLAAQRFMSPEQIAAIMQLKQNGSFVNAVKKEREANITQEMLDRGQLTPEMYRREAEILKEQNPFYFRDKTVDAIQANLSLGQDLLSGRFDGKSYKSYEQQRLDIEKALYGTNSVGNTVPAPKEENTNDATLKKLEEIQQQMIEQANQQQQGGNGSNVTQDGSGSNVNGTTNVTGDVQQPQTGENPNTTNDGNFTVENGAMKLTEEGERTVKEADLAISNAGQSIRGTLDKAQNLYNNLADVRLVGTKRFLKNKGSIKFISQDKSKNNAMSQKIKEDNEKLSAIEKQYDDPMKQLDSTLDDYIATHANGKAINKISKANNDGSETLNDGFYDFINDTSDEQIDKGISFYQSMIDFPGISTGMKQLATDKKSMLEQIKIIKNGLNTKKSLNTGRHAFNELTGTVDRFPNDFTEAQKLDSQINTQHIEKNKNNPRNKVTPSQKAATVEVNAQNAVKGIVKTLTADSEKELKDDSSIVQGFLRWNSQSEANIAGKTYKLPKENSFQNAIHANIYSLFNYVLGEGNGNKEKTLNFIKTDKDLITLINKIDIGTNTKEGFDEMNKTVSLIISKIIQKVSDEGGVTLKNGASLSTSNSGMHNKINKIISYGIKKTTDNYIFNDKFKKQRGQVTFGEYAKNLYDVFVDIDEQIKKF